jgi:hypothetical protein
MQDEQALRAKAHAAVLAGKLPARSPDRVWGGPGVGAPCEVCGSPITKDDKEFHVHIRCFAAWEFERKRPAK